MRPDPLVIGAVGGSGTRVFARIARHAELFMGRALNEHEDSQPLVDFYDAWVPLYLKRQGELSASERQAMVDSFQTAISQHRAGHTAPQGAWGVKNPRSLLMLRFWHERFPAMRSPRGAPRPGHGHLREPARDPDVPLPDLGQA